MPRFPPRSRRNSWQLPSQQERQQQRQPRVVVPQPGLLPVPNEDIVPEDYSDVVDVVPSQIYQAMERHLPPALLSAPRADKLASMRAILYKYVPSPQEILGKETLRQYRAGIASSYQPLHPELYTLNPSAFFAPSFLDAILTNTVESLTSITQEVAPGLHAFPMLQPTFCNKLMGEVEIFRNWAREKNEIIMPPTRFERPGHGVNISDIGMQGMMDDLMKQFVMPISTVLFPEFGGGSLDSQHSFVVLYGGDDGIGMHVEDCDIALIVCLGKDFTGGEMSFRGRRCVNHADSETYEEEKNVYSHVPGQALLYLGCHRNRVLPTYGFRANMTMWCRSSAFKEMMKYKTYFPDWCGKCLSEKRERQAKYINARVFSASTSKLTGDVSKDQQTVMCLNNVLSSIYVPLLGSRYFDKLAGNV